MTAAECPKGSDPNCQIDIFLNVYDLTPMNNYVYWVGLGIFHSGIEAHGAEYAFGAHDYPTSGVFEVDPKQCPGFTFRRSVHLGTTSLNAAEFRSFMEQCADEYYGDSYHLIVKNCNHFSDDVCRRLTGKPIPGWVNRLARVGYMCNCLLPEGLQVTATEAPGCQNPNAESVSEFAEGKEMVESESDQERALITAPSGNTQTLMRDSFKERIGHGDDALQAASRENTQTVSQPPELSASPSQVMRRADGVKAQDRASVNP
nr:deSI-like protein At4g17486 [Physcomitrium patens]XP_024381527.1 deSI-like protein At4g17486 [Physcomitrium patens]XP_024381528.1 deSI-like protein At4g17486 [Physcomitrium patens]XP_024381529.1 deSI-like protein At4g17486 [Physcomitrium patens]PNR50826.1 hypothetical protein PHYPA_010012 [Physcomitrium patens]|eukprot:XP_024381526.1 deSI-like protein At4g17486 [Physcomitrella patens]